MASRYNLTPERKEKLKKEVMDEIGKDKRPKIKSQNKKITPAVRKTPSPLVFKIEEKKPAIKSQAQAIKNPEIKKEIKKAPLNKEINAVVKPTSAKPVFFKEIKKPAKVKAKKRVSKPKIKIKERASPMPKTVLRKPVQTAEEKIRERDLFFRPDSPVRPSIGSVRMLKSKIGIGNKKMFILGVIICLILAFILALSIDIFGIYRLGWNGAVSQKVISILPLPAGTVDGRVISLSDYQRDLSIVKNALALDPNAPSVDSDKTKEQLFNRLVSVNIVENELKKYRQSVTDDLLEEKMNSVISQIGSKEKAIEDIKNVYGMDIATFKNNVLKPILAMDMLSKLIINDESLDINKEARKNAEDALRIAQEPGIDFKTLVSQYATDSATINQQGDMGWFSGGELPQEIETALFSLNSGEVYNQVVKDDYGYHIYKVETKLIDEESGKESIKLNQIFITANVDLYIKSLFDKAVIKRFI